jgi:cysteine desulfurase/selenocysteine lyase
MTLDLARVRDSFPILSRRIGDRALVYLDNAATSLTPEEVLAAELLFYRQVGGNVHRGTHALSEEASSLFEAARSRLAKFVSAASDEIIFTANATSALNLVAGGLDLPPESEVLTFTCDHHSTMLPWRKRFQVRSVNASPFRPLDPETLRRAIGPATKVVAFSHASNVTGLVQPAAELCRMAKDHGLISVVDAAQSAPHLRLNVRELGCDFLSISGHKMLGPTGTGVLYGKRASLERLNAPVLGGGVVERVTAQDYELRSAPARFEAGTPNIAGALGLASAAEFLERLGWAQIQAHARAQAQTLRERIASQRALRVLAAEGDALPIVSFALPGGAVRLDDIATALSDRYGVMTRAGLQCAHPLFAALELPGGALRVSAYLYNTLEELAVLGDALGELLSAFSGN